MKRGLVGFIIGLLVGILILPLAAYVYVRLGYAPVATASPPFPLEKRLAIAALNARIAREAPRQVPVSDSEENLLAGAKVYREYCAVCHGMKGQAATPTAKGMYPPPPQLFEGKGVTDDSVGDTYWKVFNGIRLTGMPAYGGSLSNVALWQVSQLLANAYHLPPSVRQYLGSEPPAK
jgi:thiosulfate dehydrogenase